MIVKVGIEAWRDIRQHSRSLERILHLETKMTTIWTTRNFLHLFKVQWNLTRPPCFLPQVLATFNIQPMQFLRQSPTLDIEEENMAIDEKTLEIAIDVFQSLPQCFSQQFNLEPFIIKPLSSTILISSFQSHILLVELQLQLISLSFSLPTPSKLVGPL